MLLTKSSIVCICQVRCSNESTLTDVTYGLPVKLDGVDYLLRVIKKPFIEDLEKKSRLCDLSKKMQKMFYLGEL